MGNEASEAEKNEFEYPGTSKIIAPFRVPDQSGFYSTE